MRGWKAEVQAAAPVEASRLQPDRQALKRIMNHRLQCHDL